MTSSDRARDEALDWARRIHDPDFAAWDEHIAWLEASESNAAAFDEALADLDNATAGLSPAGRGRPQAANDDAPFRRRVFWTTLGGGALAASVAAVLMLRPTPMPGSVRIAAGPGRPAIVPLGGRATAFLAGGAALAYRQDDPRHVRLDRGEALFDVPHDARAPFVVEASGVTLRDVGTVFDVATAGGSLLVGVRQGAVSIDTGETRAIVRGGRTMRYEGGVATIRRTPPSTVGAWRTGRLVFDDATLTEVASAVTNATGFRFSTDPSIAVARFSGVVVLASDGAALAHTLAGVTGRSVVRSGGGWRIAVRR